MSFAFIPDNAEHPTMWQDPFSTSRLLEISIDNLFPESNFPPAFPPPEGTPFIDPDLLQPHIFGEPLHASTNFAWDLPEHKFRNQYQEAHKASLETTDTPTFVAANYELKEGAVESSGGTTVLLPSIPERQNVPQGNHGTPSKIVKRSSFGVFAPVITKRKKIGVVGAAGSNSSMIATSSSSHDSRNKSARTAVTSTDAT